jgi:hypothetical protein
MKAKTTGASFLTLFVVTFCAEHVTAALLFSEDFQGGTVGATIDTLPGWTAVGDGGTQVIGSEGSNQFATTGSQNNSASRYDHTIVNPGLDASQKLVMTMDVYDPTTNPGGVSTFPRAVGGVFQVASGAFLPPYFGIEHNDATADTGIAEWVASGEDFTPQHFGTADILPQDTWFTVRTVFDLGTKTMTVSAKTRDGADPFVDVLTNVSTPFVSGSQSLSALDTWRHRLNRGTRIDNIRVESVPEPACGAMLIGMALVAAGTRFSRRLT